ncbi:MAG: putative toxin-antitoxin system toxin component, PIN family [Blastocatellia bacterium]
MNKYLVIFDTVALVQSAINSQGAARKCLAYFEQGRISIAVSRNTLAEVRAVLSRPFIRQRYEHITDELVDALTEFLSYKGIFVRHVGRHFTYPRDPNDEPYLNLAIEVRADYLISRDYDLLDLMKWNQPAGRDFQRRFRFLKIVTPEEFLQVMQQPDDY